MTATAEQLAKLPQWAQREIELLRANLAYAHEKARQAHDGDTDTWISSYVDGDQGLPRGTRIAFDLPYSGRGAPDRPARIEALVEREHVEIRVAGGHQLLIESSSSNTIRLGVERHEPSS